MLPAASQTAPSGGSAVANPTTVASAELRDNAL